MKLKDIVKFIHPGQKIEIYTNMATHQYAYRKDIFERFLDMDIEPGGIYQGNSKDTIRICLVKPEKTETKLRKFIIKGFMDNNTIAFTCATPPVENEYQAILYVDGKYKDRNILIDRNSISEILE